MKVYTDAEAGANLASGLEEARREGAVRIRRPDGQSFVLSPESRSTSPLDVPGVELGQTTDELLGFIREGRRLAGSTAAQGDEPA